MTRDLTASARFAFCAGRAFATRDAHMSTARYSAFDSVKRACVDYARAQNHLAILFLRSARRAS